MSTRHETNIPSDALRQSKKSIEIVLQEACIQHKDPETMLQERRVRESTPLAIEATRKISDFMRNAPSCDQKRFFRHLNFLLPFFGCECFFINSNSV
ncbi:hypothetical protein KIN20_036271 [Parelaphostrongylus tenuis]|uniref:Uncharacterized protein n=1 Tax=Parelaphostrongylus tenuis TaxID=148309 RepID=A0AAD5RCS2_PARTN|nr:hypothetical protein KIN20_036271 [Parelaphostrongylus tenuis]